MSYRIVSEYRAAMAGCHITTGCWPNEFLSPAGLLKHFRHGLNMKISAELPGQGIGRKWDRDYQNGLRRDRGRIEEYLFLRRRATGCSGFLSTKEMQARYPHINRQEA